MSGQDYLTAGVEVPADAGADGGGVVAATGWGLLGRYSGPFCPQAVSEIADAVTQAIITKCGKLMGGFTIKITV